MSDRSAGNPLKFLYNHNPFYLLSTLAILYALHVWQSSDGLTVNHPPATLAIVLGGFIVVLTMVGLAVVRLGGVWEDARSIFLSILLIAFAVSVSFDHLCLTNPWLAFLCIGFAFAAMTFITELILHVLRIRFPGRYRFSYYLLLALLFFYPLVFAPALAGISGQDSSWLILGFTTACAAGFLTLLPAIAYGKQYVSENGTPWKWPAYPWSIFAFLFGAISLRSYTLCLSFVPQFGTQSGFCLFFLTPLVFALFLLWLLASLENKDNIALRVIMFLAAPVLLMTTIPIDTGYYGNQFTSSLARTLGGPMWLTMVGLALFYLLAWIGNVKTAKKYFLLSMFAMGFVPTTTIQVAELQLANWWPLLLVSVIQLQDALNVKNSGKIAVCLIPGLLAAGIIVKPYVSPLPILPIILCAFLSGVLVVSVLMHDRWAHIFRLVFAIAIPVCLLGFVIASVAGVISTNGPVFGSAFLTVVCLLVFEFSKTRVYLPAALACLAMTVVSGSSSYLGMLEGLPENSRNGLIISVAFLMTGFAISFAKAGWMSRSYNSVKSAIEDSMKAIRAATPTGNPAISVEGVCQRIQNEA